MSLYDECLETDRLVATALALSDFDAICRLHRDRLVMRTLSVDGNIYEDDVTLAGLNQAVQHWQQHQFGLWAFRDKRDGQFVGRGGLKWYEVAGGTEIGLAYAVLSDYWNRGFATEMAAASVQRGFEKLGCQTIASWTLHHNQASMRVMEKLGFQFDSDITFAGLPHKFYRLAAADWSRRRSRDN